MDCNLDTDYLYVRKLLIQGKLRLGDAKLWLQENGLKLENKLVKEKENNLSKNWGSGVDREEHYINKMMGIKKDTRTETE